MSNPTGPLGNLFRRPYTPLPTRGHPPSVSTTSSPLLSATAAHLPLHLFKSRWFLSLGAISSLMFLLSYSSSVSLFSSKNHPGFPSSGLKHSVWKSLDEISWRTIQLEPVETGFIELTSPELPIPWSNKPFLPSTPMYDPSGLQVDTPKHRIEVLPRVVRLTEKEERETRVERLMFGTVTTVARAKEISILWSRWLKPFDPTFGFANATMLGGMTEDGRGPPRSACLILVAATERPREVEELRMLLKKRGMQCQVTVSEEKRYEIRVLTMVREMTAYADKLGRSFDWFVFGDDDTFWLDLRTLRRMLSQYDPTKDWFVGATTEAKNQLESFGRMAFGGAGILVSGPMLGKMAGVWDECHRRFSHVFGGDEMLTRCAALATGSTKQAITTEEKGLHQFDVPGDTTGVFQSGIPFINLHHYLGGAWVHLFGYGTYLSDMEQILLIQRAVTFLGGDNMFKRYSFGDGRWLLTMGYSLTYFESKILREDFALMEHTWYDGYRLSYDDRPVVPERHDAPGMSVKQTFYIDGVKILSPTKAIFTYAQADKWDEHLGKKERVRIQVIWDECWDSSNLRPGCAPIAPKPDEEGLVK